MTITPKELAVRLETDPRTIRKFLRSEDGKGMRVGKGQRWAIETREVKSLAKRFNAWNAAKVAKAEESDNSPDEVEALDDA